MSDNIQTAYVRQYQNTVGMLLQQTNSRLRNAVQVKACTGESAALIEQFGAVNPVFGITRHQDTPLIGVPQDRRWVTPTEAHWAELLSRSVDLAKLNIDPSNPYVQAGTAAMLRAQDDVIISKFFGQNLTGKDMTTVVGPLSSYNSGSQLIAGNVGTSGSDGGLNVKKLRAAKNILLAAEVDVETDKLFMVLTSKQHDDLLGEIQIVSGDYNMRDRPVLVDGMVKSFLGFNFILSERLPGCPNFNAALDSSITGYTQGSKWLIPFWAQSGVALGVWDDVTVSISTRNDKCDDTQFYIRQMIGATRLEEKKCGVITCV